MIRKLLLVITVLLFAAPAMAQEMATGMRSEGKIYVVVGVIVLIFAVLFVYLFIMDRRLRKLEKERDEK